MIQNPDTQTGSCCRSIIRYILNKELKRGDKLPSQEELRRELDFSHNSMTPAMNLLVESGMLERKRRLGTVVVDTDAVPAGLWRIGLAFGVLDSTPECKFETILSRYVQEKIQRAHCHARYYILNYDKIGQVPHGLSDFGLLESDVESGRLDAILSMAFFDSESSTILNSYNTPMCNIVGSEYTPFRVELDTRDFVERSIKILKEKCCRRIAIVMDCEFLANIADYIRSNIIPQPEYSNLKINFIDGSGEKERARKAADAVMSIPAKERPDGLIILNDVLALAMTSIISNTSYTPSIVVQCNKQIPLYYPMHVTKLEFDMEKLAEISVGIVINKIKYPELVVDVTKIKAEEPEDAAVLVI